MYGDVGTTLTYSRTDGRLGVVVSPALLAGQDEYNREWHRHDIRAQRMMERMYLASDTVTDRELGLEEEHERHPFFTQFLRKYGLRWIASVNIAPDPNIYAFVSVHRAPEKGAFTREECASLFRLGRHAEKSLRLGIKLMESETASGGFSELFNSLDMGVLLLDGSERIVFANDAAKGLLRGGLLESDRLAAREPADRVALQAALSAAVETDAEAALKPVILQRASDLPPLAVYVLPLRSALSPALEPLLVRSQFIVLVVEMKSGAPADPALVRDLLGLTLGEARVAALIGTGLTPREASQRLDISESTARTVLKRVFQKAGVSRQSELAALMSRAVMGTRG